GRRRGETVEDHHAPVGGQPPPPGVAERAAAPVEALAGPGFGLPPAELPEPPVEGPDAAAQRQLPGQPAEERLQVQAPEPEMARVDRAGAVVANVPAPEGIGRAVAAVRAAGDGMQTGLPREQAPALQQP